MSVKELNDALIDVKENRNEIIEKLVDFANTDLLLFWGQNKDLMERQKQTWGPILSWASEAIKTKFSTTTSLNVPNQEDKTDEKLRLFLQSLSDKELVAFFKAALTMRSVLLAAALIKGRINANEAFEAAFIEELWQSENWGVVEEAQARRDELKQDILDIEAFLQS